jgi:hypothetical protein
VRKLQPGVQYITWSKDPWEWNLPQCPVCWILGYCEILNVSCPRSECLEIFCLILQPFLTPLNVAFRTSFLTIFNTSNIAFLISVAKWPNIRMTIPEHRGKMSIWQKVELLTMPHRRKCITEVYLSIYLSDKSRLNPSETLYLMVDTID